MDDNLKEVLMSLIALISAIVTPIVVVYVNSKTNKKMDVVEKKLDESHRQMNGNLDKLIKSTEDLATLREKNKHQDKKKAT
jgi:hypothetical protein